MRKKDLNRGFTLIEILVVISIIALLSSILSAIFNTAKARGRDSAKISTSHQVTTALTTFNLDKNSMPANYVDINGNYVSNGSGNAIAFEDPTDPEHPTTASGKAYNASMQELVTGGYISAIPHSTGGQPYAYYNYGSGTSAGAMFGTNLEKANMTSTGLPGSCRPFSATTNYNPAYDINDDGIINFDDIGIVCNGSALTCDLIARSGGHSKGDTNGDGIINMTDYDNIKQAIGPSNIFPRRNNFCDQNYSTDYCVCVSY